MQPVTTRCVECDTDEYAKAKGTGPYPTPPV